MRRALLFDIDGTLIRSGGAGMRAFAGAFAHIIGPAHIIGLSEEAVRSVVPDGKTDPIILQEALALLPEAAGSGVDPDEFRREYVARLEVELCAAVTRGELLVLPGVIALLDRLQSHGDDWAIGIGTGNWRDGADAKLRHAGLIDRFSFGGYGDDGPARSDMLAAGARRAGEVESVTVIGDTVRDVEAARACGFRVVAVATGATTALAELVESQPDVALGDLSDTDLAYAAIVGQGFV